ncbi:MAG: site-specific recombinase [Oscillatoria sp. PMC 1051.18]|nr:site-specific recombinase [Oscillatoria sp. PMC 1050.18]MEC5031970.1 site-specific recombinase [Oscillatoria sp. PMC 1051.18]
MGKKQTSTEQVKQELKQTNIGVSIRERGNKLSLVATLPPKPNSSYTKPYQQRIALGIYSNPPGIKQAKALALKLGSELSSNQFSWDNWGVTTTDEPDLIKVGEAIARFEEDYFTRRDRNPKSLTTWREYRLVFSKLPKSETITEDLILSIIKSTPPDTRTRKRYCMVLGALVKFLELDFVPTIRKLNGSYSPRNTAPRNLPTDEEIENARSLIKRPDWQWIYSLIAVYGLRPHEAFLIDFERLRAGETILHLLDGKTGARKVWAFPPEWFDEWDLSNIQVPTVTVKSNRDYGARINQAFRRYGVSFKPYDLRHRWAVRTLEIGLDISLAAQQMGHSLKVHSDIYHHWISDRTHQQAYDQLFQ